MMEVGPGATLGGTIRAKLGDHVDEDVAKDFATQLETFSDVSAIFCTRQCRAIPRHVPPPFLCNKDAACLKTRMAPRHCMPPGPQSDRGPGRLSEDPLRGHVSRRRHPPPTPLEWEARPRPEGPSFTKIMHK